MREPWASTSHARPAVNRALWRIFGNQKIITKLFSKNAHLHSISSVPVGVAVEFSLTYSSVVVAVSLGKQKAQLISSSGPTHSSIKQDCISNRMLFTLPVIRTCGNTR